VGSPVHGWILSNRMGGAATLDFDRLLQPIPGDNPTGIDLRTKDPESHESPYRKIYGDVLDSRGIERDHYYKDPTSPDFALSKCQWASVVAQAVEILAEQSKDLEIAAWLCDALVHVHGFAGLRDGLRLSRELVERYWPSLYPAMDQSEEGLRGRVKQFDSVFQSRRNPCFRVPLTEGDRFTEFDYELAQQLERSSDPKEKLARIERGELSLKRFRDEVRQTSVEFYKNLVEDLEACIAEGAKFAEVLKPIAEASGAGPGQLPAFRDFNEVLVKVLALVREEAKDRLPVAVAAVSGADAAADGAAKSAGAEGQELTRDLALARVQELADFFRRTEPHSPMSHHLEEAVRWGRLALPELLTELIPDDRSRLELFTRIGIAAPKQE
jgi:type VI secretion system protein ImpA